MGKTIYRCAYSPPHRKLESTAYVDSEGGIADFKDGFWITKNGKFTKGAHCVFWIPPSSIQYVVKIKVAK